MGLPQQSFGAGLEHGPAALFDLWLPASQLGKEIIHLLLHCGLGAQAQVGGHLLTHPVPDRLISIEVWAVARQVHQAQAQSGSCQVGPQDIAAMRRGIIPNHSKRSRVLLPQRSCRRKAAEVAELLLPSSSIHSTSPVSKHTAE